MSPKPEISSKCLGCLCAARPDRIVLVRSWYRRGWLRLCLSCAEQAGELHAGATAGKHDLPRCRQCGNRLKAVHQAPLFEEPNPFCSYNCAERWERDAARAEAKPKL